MQAGVKNTVASTITVMITVQPVQYRWRSTGGDAAWCEPRGATMHCKVRNNVMVIQVLQPDRSPPKIACKYNIIYSNVTAQRIPHSE